MKILQETNSQKNQQTDRKTNRHYTTEKNKQITTWNAHKILFKKKSLEIVVLPNLQINPNLHSPIHMHSWKHSQTYV